MARALLVIGVTTVTFEGVSRLGIAYLPPDLLMLIPDKIRWSYPDEVFERPSFRIMRKSEIVEDPELGFRYASNLSVRLRYATVTHQFITDANGFANTDSSLYANADLVTVGDSFTMGWLVEPDEVWPQRLAKMRGQRVLNLGAANYDVYQYPRVLKRYARGLQPQAIIVTLTNYNDLDRRYHEYGEYRRAHPEVRGFHDYREKFARRFQWRAKGDHGYAWYAAQNVKEALRGTFPFTLTMFAYVKLLNERPRICEFTFNDRPVAYWFRLDYYEDAPLAIPYMDQVAEDLAAIKRFGAEARTPVHFVYLPAPEDIYLALLTSATPVNAAAKDVIERYRAGRFDLQRYLKAWQRALGPETEIWDATPYLREKAAHSDQVMPAQDYHLNATGHQYLAEFVAGRLAASQTDFPADSRSSR